MVDTILYIQQLTFKLRDANKRNIELCAENAQLKLQNGLLEQELERINTADTEEVIRCKDCKYYNLEFGYNCCTYTVCTYALSNYVRNENDYCSRAERKESKNNEDNYNSH